METLIFVLVVIFAISVLVCLLAIAFISGFMWLWAILSLVFVFFRRGNIGGKIFRLAWKLLIISVVLNLIGLILLLQFPALRSYDDNPIKQRIERERYNSLPCEKDGSEVFDEDATGIELEYYTFVVWEDNGTERYTVLSPGTYDFKRTIYAGKASGYAGNECSTATVKAIVGKHSWASKATVDKFFEKRK